MINLCHSSPIIINFLMHEFSQMALVIIEYRKDFIFFYRNDRHARVFKISLSDFKMMVLFLLLIEIMPPSLFEPHFFITPMNKRHDYSIDLQIIVKIVWQIFFRATSRCELKVFIEYQE
jgi:hypothetical protein